jgi:hypothetical protein
LKPPDLAQLESCIKKNADTLNIFLKKEAGKKFISYSDKIIPLIYEFNPESIRSTTLNTLHSYLMENIGFGKWHGESLPIPSDSMSSLAYNLSYLIYKKKEFE